MWDLVGNPEDRFSHNEAHIVECAVMLLVHCQVDVTPCVILAKMTFLLRLKYIFICCVSLFLKYNVCIIYIQTCERDNILYLIKQSWPECTK